MALLAPHGFLYEERFGFFKKYKMLFYINVEFRVLKLQTHFSQDVLFIGCNIFPQVIVIGLHLIKNISLGFHVYQ